jgi:hypothetical protein
MARVERRKPLAGPRVAFERLPEPGMGRAVDHFVGVNKIVKR